MPNGARKAASAGPRGRDDPSSHLRTRPRPPGPPAQSRPSAPPLANQPGAERMSSKSAPSGPPTRCGDALTGVELLEARERERHPLEREGERDDAAAVRRCGELRGIDVRRLGVRGAARLLHRVLGQAIAESGPAVCTAEGEHPGVLAGAVVEDLLRRPALLQPELEVVLGRRRLGEERADGRDLILGRAV